MGKKLQILKDIRRGILTFGSKLTTRQYKSYASHKSHALVNGFFGSWKEAKKAAMGPKRINHLDPEEIDDIKIDLKIKKMPPHAISRKRGISIGYVMLCYSELRRASKT